MGYYILGFFWASCCPPAGYWFLSSCELSKFGLLYLLGKNPPSTTEFHAVIFFVCQDFSLKDPLRSTLDCRWHIFGALGGGLVFGQFGIRNCGRAIKWAPRNVPAAALSANLKAPVGCHWVFSFRLPSDFIPEDADSPPQYRTSRPLICFPVLNDNLTRPYGYSIFVFYPQLVKSNVRPWTFVPGATIAQRHAWV